MDDLSRFKDAKLAGLETQLIYNGQLGGANKSQQHMKSLKSNDKVMSEMIKSEIHESERTVEKIKRGFSLFELDAIRKAQTQSNERMVINQDGIKQEFQHYLDLSVADMTYVDSAYNEKMRGHVVGLIQNSPAKKMIRK